MKTFSDAVITGKAPHRCDLSGPTGQCLAKGGQLRQAGLPTLSKLLRSNPELARTRSTREHHSTLLHYISANGIEDFRQKTPKNIIEIAKLLLDAAPT